MLLLMAMIENIKNLLVAVLKFFRKEKKGESIGKIKIIQTTKSQLTFTIVCNYNTYRNIQ